MTADALKGLQCVSWKACAPEKFLYIELLQQLLLQLLVLLFNLFLQVCYDADSVLHLQLKHHTHNMSHVSQVKLKANHLNVCGLYGKIT